MKRSLKDKILYPFYIPWWGKILFFAFAEICLYFYIKDMSFEWYIIVPAAILVPLITLLLVAFYNFKVPIAARIDEHIETVTFTAGISDKTYLNLSTGEISRFGGSDSGYVVDFIYKYTLKSGRRLTEKGQFKIPLNDKETLSRHHDKHEFPNEYGYMKLFQFFFIRHIDFTHDNDAKSEFKKKLVK